MTDHASALESTLSKPSDVFNKSRETRPMTTTFTPPSTTPHGASKLNQIADLLLELPHEQIKHMSREVLSDLGTVTDKSVSDMIESMLAWAHRELKGRSSAS